MAQAPHVYLFSLFIMGSEVVRFSSKTNRARHCETPTVGTRNPYATTGLAAGAAPRLPAHLLAEAAVLRLQVALSLPLRCEGAVGPAPAGWSNAFQRCRLISADARYFHGDVQIPSPTLQASMNFALRECGLFPKL